MHFGQTLVWFSGFKCFPFFQFPPIKKDMTHKIGKKSCPWRGLFAVFLEEVGDAEVLGVVVALKVVDAEGFHLVGHFFCFYAFGGDHEAQGMHGGDEVRKVGVGMAAVVECYAKTGQGWDKNLDSLCSILESELKTLDATFRFHTGGSLMKYTKKERMNIGRQIYEDQINKYEAAGKYGISAQTAREYMRMYRNTNHLPPKTSKPRDYGLAKAKVIPEAAKLDEYQKMSKEDLISALIDARIREERLKLGYEVVEEDDSKKKLITYVKKTAK